MILAQLPINLNLDLLLPELLVLGAAFGAIISELLLPAGRRAVATAGLSVVGLLVAFLVLVLGGKTGVAMEHVAESGKVVTAWQADGFAYVMRGIVLLGSLLIVLVSIPYTSRMDKGHGEFYAILLFSIFGVLLVCGVSDLLNLFVALELVTISAFILAAFRRNDLRSTEAGLKYLVIGAVSTALLLLGIALTYGSAGAMDFASIAAAMPGAPAFMWIGVALLLSGLLFKLGGVPFHVWIPDVYQGSPAPVTAFLATLSKAAGVILAMRLAQEVIAPAQLAGTGVSWIGILGAVAVVTLLFGSLAAIPQRDIKRMLGYSGIGHAGYLLMGIAAMATGNPEVGEAAASALTYYLMAYIVTGATAFAVIVLVTRTLGSSSNRSFAGLHARNPFLAFAMCLALLSLAGVPPMSGFFGKFLILAAAVEGGLLLLALVGALGVVIGLYFYLCWIREIYFQDPDPEADGSIQPVPAGWASKTVIWIGIAGMLAMGIVQGPFFDIAKRAASGLFAVGP